MIGLVFNRRPTKDGLNIVYALQGKLLVNEYYATGDFVARAFAVGKTIKRQN